MVLRTPTRPPRRGIHTWNPFADFGGLLSQFDRLPMLGSDGGTTGWLPSVDITEDAERYRVQAELPGMKSDDVQVDVCNNVLIIAGERHDQHEESGATVHRVERSYGSFNRRFSLPEGIDEDGIDARFEDGVLTVEIPKAPASEPETKRIQVKD